MCLASRQRSCTRSAPASPTSSRRASGAFDGAYHWCQIRGLPLRDASGRITRWYSLLSDVEDRKRAEDGIDKLRSELAHVARATTLSALTASIAHEINQPLSGIMTNAGTCLRMLDSTPPDIDGARETARRTIRDGSRASDVITRLRSLFTRREFTPESLDLNEAAREVVALSWTDLQRNRIVVQLELADDLPVVTGDRIQLQQVILNLLRNASDAMADVQDRPRQLLIRTKREDGDHVRLTIRDAGSGLSSTISNRYSTPSTRQKAAAWASGCLSAVRSSSDITVACGPSRTTRHPARHSRSPFRGREYQLLRSVRPRGRDLEGAQT
jgi:signal transduction histidine kinase